MTARICVWSIPGVISNGTKRTGDQGRGLEPDEGQLSCPVLRGLGGSNVSRLPARWAVPNAAGGVATLVARLQALTPP